MRSFVVLAFVFFRPAHAEIDWLSLTIDNDVFVGNDDGYSNGFFFSLYDTSGTGARPSAKFWVKPLLWSLSDEGYAAAVNSYTIGQAIITPDDITISNPPENDLPYSGLLFFNNTYLAINETYADKLGATLGIIGPSSGAKSTQIWFHDLIDADDPNGWNTQLNDELVFQFSRGRVWRSWVSGGGRFDFLLSSEASLGTLSSAVDAGMMIRYGKDLMRSYATPLLSGSRTSNPVAIKKGWFVYAGVSAGYIFNRIFTDGNTYRDSRSIDYDHEYISALAGFAYSWQNISVTLALNDTNILENESEDQLQDYTRYGTLTFAWRH